MSKTYLKEMIAMSDDALNNELESITLDDFRKAVKFALKEQDRDTRHACAEACLQQADSPAIEMIDRCHAACMNVNAV